MLSTATVAFSLTFEQPANGETVRDTTLLNVSAPDASTVRNVTFYDNRSGAFTNNITTQDNSSFPYFVFQLDTTTLADGTIGLNATGRNASGTVNSTAIAVTVDNTAPTVSVHDPAASANVTGTVWVNATVQDNNTDTFQYRWENSTGHNVTKWQSQDGANQTFDTTTEDDGAYTLVFEANDTAGNERQVTRDVYINNKAPTVTWDSGTYWLDAPTVAVKVTDALGVNRSSITLKRNGTAIPDSALSVTSIGSGVFEDEYRVEYTNSSLDDGTNYNFSLAVVDAAASGTRSWINRSIDTEQPAAPENVAVTNSTVDSDVATAINGVEIALNWSQASDNVSSVDHLELLVRNRTYNRSTQQFAGWTAWTVADDTLGGGATDTRYTGKDGYEYEFRVRAVDTAGNRNASNTAAVAVDTQAPQFAQDSGADDVTPERWTTSSTPTVEAVVTDVVGIDNQSVTMNISNSTWNASLNVSLSPVADNASTYTVTADSVPALAHNDTYTVTVGATDRFDRVAALDWSFETDQEVPENPTVSEFLSDTTYVDGNNTWNRDEYTMQVDCADAVSGIDAVSAFIGGTKHAGWNTTVPGNLTLTGSGKNAYTVKCRDVAGNVNDNESRTVYIDTQDPVLQDSSVDDGDTSVDLNFTFTATVDDAESGINTSASSLVLETGTDQDGTLGNVSWNGDEISGDVSGLNADDPYTLELTAVDNVGHTKVVEIGFRTEGSSGGDSEVTAQGGGGQGVAELTISQVPSMVSIVPGASQQFTVNVENTGDVDLKNIEANVDVAQDLDVTVTPLSFDLAAGDDRSVVVDITAKNETAATAYQATITAAAGKVSTEKTVDLEVTGMEPVLSIGDAPATITVVQESSANAAFTIENTGAGRAEDVMASFVADVPASIAPETFDIGADDSRQVTVSAAPTRDTAVGVYTGVFTVEHADSEKTLSVDVKVQPAADEQKQEITEKVDVAQTRFDRVRDQLPEQDEEELASMIAAAENATEQGDYARAAELYSQIEETLSEQDPAKNGLPMLPLAGIFLAVMIAAGAGYVYWAEDVDLAALLEPADDTERATGERQPAWDVSSSTSNGVNRQWTTWAKVPQVSIDVTESASRLQEMVNRVRTPDQGTYTDQAAQYSLKLRTHADAIAEKARNALTGQTPSTDKAAGAFAYDSEPEKSSYAEKAATYPLKARSHAGTVVEIAREAMALSDPQADDDSEDGADDAPADGGGDGDRGAYSYQG